MKITKRLCIALFLLLPTLSADTRAQPIPLIVEEADGTPRILDTQRIVADQGNGLCLQKLSATRAKLVLCDQGIAVGKLQNDGTSPIAGKCLKVDASGQKIRFEDCLVLAQNMKTMSGLATTTASYISFGVSSYAVSVFNLDTTTILWIKFGATTCTAGTANETPIDPGKFIGIGADIATDKICVVTASGTANYEVDILY